MATRTDLITNTINPRTGAGVVFTKVTKWRDGTTDMTDSLCGGVYNKIGNDYVKYPVEGPWPLSRINPTAANFVRLLNDFANDPQTIIVDKSVTIASNLTIPKNITLQINEGCPFLIGAGITLTVQGAVIAGNHALHTGAGTLIIDNQNVSVKKVATYAAMLTSTVSRPTMFVIANDEQTGLTNVSYMWTGTEAKVLDGNPAAADNLLKFVTNAIPESKYDWLTSLGAVSDSASNNSGILHLPSRTITVPVSSTGTGSFIVCNFIMPAGTKINDEIKIRAVLTETIANTLSVVTVSLIDNGNASGLTPVVSQMADRTFQYVFTYKVVNVSSAIKIRMQITGSATNANARAFSIAGIDVYSQQRQAIQAGAALKTSFDKADELYANKDKSVMYTKCNPNGTEDVSDQLQAEMDLAISTGRILDIGKGTYRITKPLDIKGALIMRGYSTDLAVIEATFAGNMFKVTTVASFSISQMTIYAAASYYSTGISFGEMNESMGVPVVNLNSEIRQVNFRTRLMGIKLDYVEGLNVTRCRFTSIDSAILVATAADSAYVSANPSYLKNITVSFNTFVGIELISIDGYFWNGLTICNNRFVHIPGQTIHHDNCLRLRSIYPVTSERLLIYENEFLSFNAYAMFISTGANVAAKSEGIQILSNYFKDASAITNTKPIYVFSELANAISNVAVMDNIVFNKNTGVGLEKCVNVIITGNSLIGTGNTGSRPISVSACSYMIKSNLIMNQEPNYDFVQITGGTLISEYLRGSQAYTPGAIPAMSVVSVNVTVNGARMNNVATASFSIALGAVVMLLPEVVSNNTVKVTFFNPTNAAVSVGAGTVIARVTYL